MIEAVHRGLRLFMAADGEIFPIVRMFDSAGNDTDDIDEAISAVAGAGNRWFAFLLPDFDQPASVH